MKQYRVQLNALQLQLEQIYDLSTPHRVEDFLLVDPGMAGWLCNTNQAVEEQLLVRENEDGLEVSLFLRETLLARLSDDDPTITLHTGNLADFCLAVEGVSHFLHLVWNAGHDRSVTRLELELLSEIDKFVTATALACQQTGSTHSLALWRALFRTCRFRNDLEPECRQRYYEANRLAALYCDTLQGRFELAPGDPGLHRELRRFQRLPKSDKIHHIESRSQRA